MLSLSPLQVKSNINYTGLKDSNNNNKTHAGLKTAAISSLVIESITIPLLNGANLKNVRWLNVVAFIGSSLGCGALIDGLINNKRQKGENNNAIGKKVGTALGAGVITAFNLFSLGKGLFTKPGAKLGIISGAFGAFGGFILGAITDKCANSAYRKHNS